MSRNTLRIDVFQNFKLQIESCADKFVTRAAKVPEIAPKFLCTKNKTKKNRSKLHHRCESLLRTNKRSKMQRKQTVQEKKNILRLTFRGSIPFKKRKTDASNIGFYLEKLHILMTFLRNRQNKHSGDSFPKFCNDTFRKIFNA